MKPEFRAIGQDCQPKQSLPALMPSLLRAAAVGGAIVALANDQIVESNPYFCALLGYDAAELRHYHASQLNLWTQSDRAALLQQVYQQGILHQYACQLRHKSGQLIQTELSIELVECNDQPHLLLLSTGSPDWVLASAQEKAILLKEIHHRVRNNLHLITNLLDLQAGVLHDDRLSTLFSATQNRIQAMALIHEQLYQSADLVQVNLGEYLHRLMLNVFLANSSNLKAVKPIIQAEPVFLNLETAVPCGLLVNELLVNSLNHAFPNNREGEVQIQLQQMSDRQVYLQVTDNGIGLPTDLDWQQVSSLGFKLVRILAKQLKAEIQITQSKGTSAQIFFSELQYQQRFSASGLQKN